MKIIDIQVTNLDLQFTPLAHQHLQYWIPSWRIFQVCRITLENNVEGWGETPRNVMGAVPEDIAERIVGRPAGELLWEDSLGSAVQMALFDAVSKALDVPVHRLLGTQMRQWCPLSWWTIDLLPEDWAQQCAEAVKQGYTSAKLKARTHQDLHAGIRAILKVVPPHFRLDLDFNGSLANAAQAVEFLKTLEQYKQVAMIESPIPQGDVAGNQHIRQHLNRPVAMHLGDPPMATALTQDVADGFIIGGGASAMMKQATICEVANKPFWLQLVGTGLTTTWAAHVGAVCAQARWPAITCMNIYKSPLIKEKIELRGGLYRVPEKPGLGVEVDQKALKKYAVDYSDVSLPRHLYRYTRASGETVYYGCVSKSEMHGVYRQDAMPVCEAGARLEPIPDDGSEEFEVLYRATRHGRTLRQWEKPKKKKKK